MGHLGLGEARNAGAYLQALRKSGDTTLDPLGQRRALGTWADQAHLALQHVEHLRQLVQMVPAQHAADRGGAGVTACGPYRSGVLLGILHHGAELDDEKNPAVATQPRLTVKHRPGALQPDGERDDRTEQHP